MFEPRRARLRAPVLRVQIVAAVLLSAIALVAMWAAAHPHDPGSHPQARASAAALAGPAGEADRTPFPLRG